MAKKNFGSYKEKSIGQWHGDLEGDVPLESQHSVFGTLNSTDNQHHGTIKTGQRWISIMEPELGVGTVMRSDGKRVTLSFQGGSCVRQYSLAHAPIKRLQFQKGDMIRTQQGNEYIVESHEEENGILFYHCNSGKIIETQLHDHQSITTPLQRLVSGNVDSNANFNIRSEVLIYKCRFNSSVIRGFIGGRIHLIPHQLYIAKEVVSLRRKRVLLADEVGLGKTIEACLILHQLLVSEYAVRVLVLVPESLVHVWFVELLRKFNLSFRIYNEESYQTTTDGTEQRNVFFDDQLILGSIDFFATNPSVHRDTLEAQWDLLIVDEAHGLFAGSAQFSLVESLSFRCKDILFLTATPQRHGQRNHFQRLHVLDPARYVYYDNFIKEMQQHEEVAHITGRILDNEEFTEKDTEALLRLFPDCSDILDAYTKSPVHATQARRQLVAGLIDRYGIGRAMFRNTRCGVGGFPPRTVVLAPIDASEQTQKQVTGEFQVDSGRPHTQSYEYTTDQRLLWLITLLYAKKTEKFLLICHSREKTQAIVSALKQKTTINVAEFHEQLTLLQRDRQAAWFTEDDGARILVCSEIGSEGRNFQCADNLVLWDIPLQPDLIEQRIGRLDRIGRSKVVVIYLPYIRNTPYATLVRVFHEGLDLFSHSLSGANEMVEKISDKLFALLDNDSYTTSEFEQKMQECIASARKWKETISSELEKGRDRLLEQHSFRPKEAALLVKAIQHSDTDDSFENFALKLYKAYGIIVEEISPHTYNLMSATLMDENFPGLAASRPLVTFDRNTALNNEQIEFITPDHPSIRGGIDLFLGSERGKAALALWHSSGDSTLLAEVIFVLECTAPLKLMTDRFLPPTPIRVVVDYRCSDCSDLVIPVEELVECNSVAILQKPEIKQSLLPAMQAAASGLADVKSAQIRKLSLTTMREKTRTELDRLTALHAVNSSVSREEIDALVHEMNALECHIRDAKPRLEAIRLIQKIGQ